MSCSSTLASLNCNQRRPSSWRLSRILAVARLRLREPQLVGRARRRRRGRHLPQYVLCLRLGRRRRRHWSRWSATIGLSFLATRATPVISLRRLPTARRGAHRRRIWRAATATLRTRCAALRTRCAAHPCMCLRLRHLVISPPDRPVTCCSTVSFARSLCAWQAVSLSELLALAELPQPTTQASAAGIEEAAEHCTRTVCAVRTCGACCACCTCTCDACRACRAARELGPRGVDREAADVGVVAAFATTRASRKKEGAARRRATYLANVKKSGFTVTAECLDAGKPASHRMRRVARVAIAALSNRDGVYVICDKSYRVSAQRRAIASAMRASGVSQLVVEAQAECMCAE